MRHGHLHFWISATPETMKTKSSSAFYFAVSALIFAFCFNFIGCEENKDVYIVYMGSLPENNGEYSPLSHHVSILQDVLGDGFRHDSLVRTYGRSFNGFAAWLSEEERERMAAREDIMSIFPRKMLTLQTTRSWDFIGFPLDVKRVPAVESDIIIGMIDSGITPNSESFSDQGFGPPPKKWKGSCEANFTCNNKIIGARSYPSGDPTDEEGHGTHTASIAAGNVVSGANFYGLAGGIARGGVLSARLAVYKVCSPSCSNVDILKAFDDAIADGVDIISISLGGLPDPIDYDVIAIGSFHAMEKNVLTIQSTGNYGLAGQPTGSMAPWIFTVGASTTDRNIMDKIVLGNGTSFLGRSVNGFTLNGTNYPLLYGNGVSTTCDVARAMDCEDSCLDSKLVKDKIVVCRLPTGKVEAARAGAVGAIYTDDLTGRIDAVRADALAAFHTDDSREAFSIEPLPAACVDLDTLNAVIDYVNSTKNPHGYITKSTSLKDGSAPMPAGYSSRGPNFYVEDILKPDISAPGTSILAAFSPLMSPSMVSYDTRRVKYSILSGTSMAAPHVAGAAAYVKTFHPNWSASAIKSALMTTASRMNDGPNDPHYSDAEFAYGSGLMNPTRAIDPGLVYEIPTEEYLKIVCSMNITSYGKCPREAIGASQRDLNYPSMQALVKKSDPVSVTFRRTVKNVGEAISTYKAEVKAPGGIEVVVKPTVLSFEALNQELSFEVTVTGPPLKTPERASASLVWSDGLHNVRSPVVVYTKGRPF